MCMSVYQFHTVGLVTTLGPQLAVEYLFLCLHSEVNFGLCENISRELPYNERHSSV
jgi:hypothetical protein